MGGSFAPDKSNFSTFSISGITAVFSTSSGSDVFPKKLFPIDPKFKRGEALFGRLVFPLVVFSALDGQGGGSDTVVFPATASNATRVADF